MHESFRWWMFLKDADDHDEGDDNDISSEAFSYMYMIYSANAQYVFI